jgi:hypothetical protein
LDADRQLAQEMLDRTPAASGLRAAVQRIEDRQDRTAYLLGFLGEQTPENFLVQDLAWVTVHAAEAGTLYKMIATDPALDMAHAERRRPEAPMAPMEGGGAASGSSRPSNSQSDAKITTAVKRLGDLSERELWAAIRVELPGARRKQVRDASKALFGLHTRGWRSRKASA